ncbi:DUF6171 family protein [Ruminococcus sp. NK3A76]|uniref:DUF6171 family protein n=1 Tax=Ruminococcus sp. NK3A76 TaxID=877411 RepID=UPI00048EB9AD|nr:DUF6171 family protein [Ruminococcus sp. NK3A76]
MSVICRRCLLEDMQGDELYRSVQERISLLDESVRTDKRTYAERLEKCRSCDELTNGMCALCGCFAELRAAKKDMHCPGKQKLW